jgi:hypothetical protein
MHNTTTALYCDNSQYPQPFMFHSPPFLPVTVLNISDLFMFQPHPPTNITMDKHDYNEDEDWVLSFV